MLTPQQKFDNMIYLSICEALYIEFKKTHRENFYGYCTSIKAHMKSKNVFRTAECPMYSIMNYVGTIYSFTDAVIINYILDFFEYEVWIKVIDTVRLTEHCFKNSVC